MSLPSPSVALSGSRRSRGSALAALVAVRPEGFALVYGRAALLQR